MRQGERESLLTTSNGSPLRGAGNTPQGGLTEGLTQTRATTLQPLRLLVALAATSPFRAGLMLELVRRTKRLHRLRGSCRREPTEGEQLEAFGSFEPLPFRHGFAMPLSPPAGTAFGLSLHDTKRLPHRGSWKFAVSEFSEGVLSTERLKILSKAPFTPRSAPRPPRPYPHLLPYWRSRARSARCPAGRWKAFCAHWGRNAGRSG